MFGLFKSKEDKLNGKYQKLMEEAFKLSSVNRMKSDKKVAEAEAILKEIEELNRKQ